jgi:hypothetical protein
VKNNDSKMDLKELEKPSIKKVEVVAKKSEIVIES